ncbi:MAG TPA: nuclear transport factor 2 family protein [Candidatus Angelobacter sp.]|nr:nuclear transport factor 2 family protein [Candidatus Angelobacter sp.]
MRPFIGCSSVACALAGLLFMQQAAGAQTPGQEKRQAPASGATKLKEILESNVKAEWEAFKNRNKQTYSDLLADDFAAVEDDNEGMRKKSVAVSEVDNSVVNNFHLFALTVIPLSADAALVTYEITLEFPPKAQVRFKRVLVSEVWVKRNSQWKERYYQETHVR